METKEIWKDIPGYEGLYQVSNKGNVKSLNYKRTGKSQLLKFNKIKNGYLKVRLTKNNSYKLYSIHRLVVCTFNNVSLNTALTVNHKDGNKENNNLTNLELCTVKENIEHALLYGLRDRPIGVKNPKVKLTEEQVKQIRKELNIGYKISDLANKYRVAQQTISKIKNGQLWKHL